MEALSSTKVARAAAREVTSISTDACLLTVCSLTFSGTCWHTEDGGRRGGKGGSEKGRAGAQVSEPERARCQRGGRDTASEAPRQRAGKRGGGGLEEGEEGEEGGANDPKNYGWQ